MEDLFSLNWLFSHPSIRQFKMNYGHVELDYFTYGNNPQLCITSGMHGDEYETIISVSHSIAQNLALLPSFVYVPIVAPTAVAAKTRNNKMGQDVNRGFLKKSATDESQALMNLVKPYRFNLSVSFHEDPLLSEFYIYDTIGKNEARDISPLYTIFKQKLTAMDIGLFNGIDDPTDPHLGYVLTDGYKDIKIADKKTEYEDGQFETWITTHSISKRSFNPEIPGNFPQKRKDSLVECIFTDLILPFVKM